jgi:hypothetical protein
MSNELTKMSTELLAMSARGFVTNTATAWDRENLRDCIDELEKRAAVAAGQAPAGFAIVPVDHTIADHRHRWDRMCLAAAKALRDPGFNSNEMVAAARGEWNSSNLVRQIVAAAVGHAAHPQSTGTLSLTHGAISTALSENLPLTQDQRAALLGLVARDKQAQAADDEDVWSAVQVDGIVAAVRDHCGPATAARLRRIIEATPLVSGSAQ